RILYGEAFPQGLESLRRAGVADGILRTIERQKNGLLALRVETEGVKEALAGREGLATYQDYRGELVVGSYAPFDFGSNRWALLAEMDTAEAFAPIQAFGRRVVMTTAGIALATTLLGLLLSNLFIAPVRTLTAAARRIAAGEVGAQAEVNTRDEFRSLADAFNDMSRGLKEKTQQLQQKVRENEDLLLNILPAPAAARLREGDANPTQSFCDVTVLYAEVVGLLELTDRLGSEKGLQLLHDLVVAFDEAAEQLGVEKVKTSGATYLAVCGLSVQRPDHTSRVVEFAQELQRIVERFNRERGSDLRLQVGINAGPVTGGVVGRNKFIYDLWGDTVSVARGLRKGQTDGVRLTRSVYDRVADQYSLSEPEQVDLPGRGSVESWSLKTKAG
ncbi:MAG: adenylate/guanylate cyclase domain-containing protein, partial [Planctomycetaceae bacterium]